MYSTAPAISLIHCIFLKGFIFFCEKKACSIGFETSNYLALVVLQGEVNFPSLSFTH
jgi:hypothetical protein